MADANPHWVYTQTFRTFAAMHKNGGGIHCSTTPLRRDAV